MHVFPGLHYFDFETEYMWQHNYTHIFLDLLRPYTDDIMLFTGAHIHTLSIRDTMYVNNANFSVPFLITPAFSPQYSNNPSYTTLEVNYDPKTKKQGIFNLKVDAFQLQYYQWVGVK